MFALILLGENLLYNKADILFGLSVFKFFLFKIENSAHLQM
jgi:hypothetical protein